MPSPCWLQEEEEEKEEESKLKVPCKETKCKKKNSDLMQVCVRSEVIPRTSWEQRTTSVCGWSTVISKPATVRREENSEHQSLQLSFQPCVLLRRSAAVSNDAHRESAAPPSPAPPAPAPAAGTPAEETRHTHCYICALVHCWRTFGIKQEVAVDFCLLIYSY